MFADAISGDIWALSATAPYSAERLGDGGSPVAFAEDAAGELYLADLGGRVFRVHLDGKGGSGTTAACVNAANARIAKYVNAAEKDTRQCASLAAKEKLAGVGANIAGGTPEDFARHIQAETAKWAKVVKESGAKVD